VVPQILEALVEAVDRGLRLPLVYNTSSYDSMESLRSLHGVVDIYMPDFKYWDTAQSLRYVKAKDYSEAARRSIREMHRQVGPLRVDERGVALRGVLVRHLVMPGGMEETSRILEWLAREISPDTYVNLMDQYHPAGRVSRTEFVEINRRLTMAEFEWAQDAARRAGLRRTHRG
jgi:putative pyruvate formate lyase activating enzyme